MRRALFGAGVGAIGGLIVATIWNLNCDSATEALNGCTRLDPGSWVGIGAIVGFVAGLLSLATRRRRKQDPPT
jgi:hypothetical protein